MESCFAFPLGSLSLSLPQTISYYCCFWRHTYTHIHMSWPSLIQNQKLVQLTGVGSWRFLDILLKQQNLSSKIKTALVRIFIQHTLTEHLLGTRHEASEDLGTQWWTKQIQTLFLSCLLSEASLAVRLESAVLSPGTLSSLPYFVSTVSVTI